ncbi:MAG TPA: hypothetical protein VNS46_06140 [Nocardioides sp.]|nr:hypothetical protein [Nocardioides sp.]
MRRRTSLVTAVAATALLAAGCGLTDDGPRPGLAAEVEGQSLQLDKVDRALTDYCGLLASEEGTPTYSKAALRSQLAWNWAQAIAVEELAPSYGVELPTSVETSVVERSWKVSRDDESFDSFEWLTWIGQRLDQPLVEIGTRSLRDLDTTGQQPAPQAAQTAGLDLVDEWLEEHDVELNPVFGPRDAEQNAFLGDALSVAVSGRAKQGDTLALPVQTQEEANAKLAELPANELCGRPVEAQPAPVG